MLPYTEYNKPFQGSCDLIRIMSTKVFETCETWFFTASSPRDDDKKAPIPVFSTGPWSSSIGCNLDPSSHGRSNVHGAGIRSSSQQTHVAFATGNAGGDPLEKGNSARLFFRRFKMTGFDEILFKWHGDVGIVFQHESIMCFFFKHWEILGKAAMFTQRK